MKLNIIKIFICVLILVIYVLIYIFNMTSKIARRNTSNGIILYPQQIFHIYDMFKLFSRRNIKLSIHKSNIKDAGFGLFAGEDIKKGEIVITYYSFHTNDINSEKKINCDTNNDKNNDKNNDTNKKNTNNNKIINEDSKINIETINNNKNKFTNSMISSYINDVNFEYPPDRGWSKKNIFGYFRSYIENMKIRKNHKHNLDTCVVYLYFFDFYMLIANRDIKKGDELYKSYGLEIWLILIEDQLKNQKIHDVFAELEMQLKKHYDIMRVKK